VSQSIGMEQYVIGVDIGTGSAKAVAINNAGKPIAVSQIFYKTNSPQPGFSEQDPEVIWKAFLDCITKVIAQLKQVPGAVSISCAMHSLIIIDQKNIPITPLITWEDTRSEKIAEDLRNSSEAENIYTVTGTPIHSMTPLCKIKWFKENTPGIYKKANKFISIKEFIWFRLFGVYEIDYSIASATGLFNIQNFTWNRPSLDFCGINPAQLSEIVSTDFCRKNISSSLAETSGLPASINFCIGASDGCLANIGSDAIDPGIAAITIGTSGAVRIAGANPVINYEAMIFNYVLDKQTFISGGPVNNGGNVLKWLFKTFWNNDKPNDKDYEDFFKEVESAEAGCKGLLFLPYLHGERAPVWDGEASGVFFGIRSYHSRTHFLRAALEGICFSLKNILEILELSSAEIKQLNVSGGFVRSKIWMQILADISGKKLCLVQTEDASSIGAAIFYMKSAQLIKDYSSLKEEVVVTINPDEKNKILYNKSYKVFKNLYQPLKESMHELLKLNMH
jgi:gluconokinase